MTGQPDIAAALAWSGEAARAAANAQAALRGEPVPVLLISSEAHLAGAEASPANPYGSFDEDKHGSFGGSALCPATMPAVFGDRTFKCMHSLGHDGPHAAEQGPGVRPVTWTLTPLAYIEPAGRWETAEPGDVTRAGAAEPQCEASWGAEGNWLLCLLPGGHTGPHKNDVATWDEPGDVTP